MFHRGWRAAVMGASAAVVMAPSAWADGPDTSYRPFGWTGFYIGIHGGGAWSGTDWDNVTLTGTAHNFDTSGIIAGGQLGFRFNCFALVCGVEGSLSGTSLSDRDDLPPNVTYQTDVDWIGTLTGRVGVATPLWYGYVKGGWAWANLELRGNESTIPDSFSLSRTANGWTAGAGVEFKFAPNSPLSIAFEYNFIDLGSFNASGVTTAGFPFAITNVDTEIHSITARVNVRLP